MTACRYANAGCTNETDQLVAGPWCCADCRRNPDRTARTPAGYGIRGASVSPDEYERNPEGIDHRAARVRSRLLGGRTSGGVRL